MYGVLIICSIIPTAVNIPCPNFNVVVLFFIYSHYSPLTTNPNPSFGQDRESRVPARRSRFDVEFCFICNAIRVSIHVLRCFVISIG